MELLEEETWNFRKKGFAMNYAFFYEENYQKIISHQEAALAFLNYKNRLWALRIWAIKTKDGKFTSREYEKKYQETREEKIIYTNLRSFDEVKGYPIQVNPELMNSKKISVEEFFEEKGTYEHAFMDNPQNLYGKKEDFIEINQQLFPEKKGWKSIFGIMNLPNIIMGGEKDLEHIYGQSMMWSTKSLL